MTVHKSDRHTMTRDESVSSVWLNGLPTLLSWLLLVSHWETLKFGNDASAKAVIGFSILMLGPPKFLFSGFMLFLATCLLLGTIGLVVLNG